MLTACGGGGGGISPTTSLTEGAAGQTAMTGSGGPVKIALLLPLSGAGDSAKIATDLKQAGELALFEFDRADIALISKDTTGTPDGARAAAEAAIRDGAELIVGPLFAAEVAAVAPVARAANVPVIAFSSDRKVAGDGVFLLSFLAGDDVQRVVQFTTGSGRTSFAGLIPQTAYGDIVERAFKASVKAAGGRIAVIERLPMDADGMLVPVQRLKTQLAQANQAGEPVQALLIPGGQDTLPSILPMLSLHDMDLTGLKLIGTGGWDYPNIGQDAALEGGWYPAPDPAGWRDFTQRYAKTYSAAPARIASLSYDAVSLAVSLAGGPPGARYTAETLTRSSGFAGIDGLFRLKPDGTSQRGLAVLEVHRSGPSVVDPAPSAFQAAQF